MRDHEFMDEFERLTPRLEKLFSKAIRTFCGDKAVEIDDLLQETAKQALRNSRLEKYNDYTCKRLIYKKALNLIHEYYHPPQKKVPAFPLEKAENKTSSHDPYVELTNRQWLESIYRKVDRETWIICYLDYAGYKQEEIAAHLGLTVPAVKMKIYRARQRLNRNH